MKGSGIHIKPPTADFEFRRIAHRHGDRLHGECSRRGPERAKINFGVGCGCRIEQQGDTVDARAICLSNSSHLPAIEPSILVKPVVWPPGRGRLAARPLSTGSATVPKMMGIVRVCCSSASVVDVVDEGTTSSCDATSC